jgi:peptidylprolyl isomerase
MSQAKTGDNVRLHYTGKLDNGEVFDSSRSRGPIEVKLGSGQVIPGFDRTIRVMSTGETKTVEVPAAEAYGQRQDGNVIEFDRDNLPAGTDPQVGQQMRLQTQDGRAVPATVTNATETAITMDANHPLAGKDLTFELELLEIV